MTFKNAVEASAEPIRSAYREGLKALESKHTSLITVRKGRGRITGSINFDTTFSGHPRFRDKKLWDYGIGFKPSDERGNNEQAIWVEVHPAATSNVGEMLGKLAALRSWLASDGRDLDRLTRRSPESRRFVWLATNAGVHIPRNSSQARELALSGISQPRHTLELS